MLGKNLSVYDSQIRCQQGRAFVRNLALPRRGGTPVWKKKGILVASQSGRVSRFICPFELVCTKIRLHFAALWRATKIEKIFLSKTRKQTRLLSPSLKRNGIIYNHGLNKVANRFGILKFLLAYNNNKIISENVGKSYFQLNFVHWTLAPGSWLLAPGSWLPITPDTMFPYGGQPLLKNAGSS